MSPMPSSGEQGGSVVVLVIGLPGAGKSTLIDRAANSSEWTVVDPHRSAHEIPSTLRKAPVLYPLYVLGIVGAIARHTHVAVESRGTYGWLRRLVTTCARVRGRKAVLVMLDASSADASAGQEGRGRRVESARVMRWHTTRWSELLDAVGTGALAAEGWGKVVVLDRAQASNVDDLGELVSSEA